MCVCVCVCARARLCVCVCVCVCKYINYLKNILNFSFFKEYLDKAAEIQTASEAPVRNVPP